MASYLSYAEVVSSGIRLLNGGQLFARLTFLLRDCPLSLQRSGLFNNKYIERSD